jgi:flagellar assembly protein FliH
LTDFAPLLFADLTASAAGRADDPAVVRGHAAGYAAGLRVAERELAARRAEFDTDAALAAEESRRRVESALAALDAAAARFDARLAPVLAEADRTLTSAALELATAILHREPVATPAEALDRALALAGDEAPRRIRLHPADVVALGSTGASRVELVADVSVPAGEAVVELPHGEVDGRIQASLARVRAALADETGEER